MGQTVATGETIDLGVMRMLDAVVALSSFTKAAARLGIPKQTLSRRVAQAEETLGARLLHRTTRRVSATDAGLEYVARCREILRLAEDAAAGVRERTVTPSGTLRVTADPVLGDAFLTGLVIDYARRFPDVDVEVVLTRRRVDLAEEGFDVAFRVGRMTDPRAAKRLGPARIRYCASPEYVRRRGVPERPADLSRHDCIVVASDGVPVRWPFRKRRGEDMVPVNGRLRVTSFDMAHEAALAGLGIAIFPEFACTDDLRTRRLTAVLDDHAVDVGGVWLLHRPDWSRIARVRAFVELALARPFDVTPKTRRR